MSIRDVIEARERGDIAELSRLLRHGDPLTVRYSAARSLGNSAQPEALVALLESLHAEDDGLRIASARALGVLGNVGAADELVLVAETDPASGVRAAAVEALAINGDHRGIEMLTSLAVDPAPALLRNTDRHFRAAVAGRLLARIGSTEEEELYRVRLWALKLIRRLEAVEALPALKTAPPPRALRERLTRWQTIRTLQAAPVNRRADTR